MTGQFAVYYNGHVIRQVEEYKYLGGIIRPIEFDLVLHAGYLILSYLKTEKIQTIIEG